MPYSQKVDIFSMGIILFELLIPFNTETERYLLLNNARKRVFPKEFSDKYVSEVRNILDNTFAIFYYYLLSVRSSQEVVGSQSGQKTVHYGDQRSRTAPTVPIDGYCSATEKSNHISE